MGRYSNGRKGVVHATQQLDDLFNIVADGVGIFLVAWRWHLDADEKLLRRRDFGICGIHGRTRFQSCAQQEVGSNNVRADDDLDSLFAVNRVPNFVANDFGKSEDGGGRVRMADA